MALLERVSTLLRANINDLLLKAEDPEKMARQLVLDMENQLMQVKTQVAMALADQHMLAKKLKAEEDGEAQWRRKAGLAVSKGQDEMARAALERGLGHRRMAEGLREQLADQTTEADTLRGAYTRLQQKLTETQGRVELLTAQLRRSRAQAKAASTQATLSSGETGRRLAQLAGQVEESAARSEAARTVVAIGNVESLEDRFAAMEQSDEIEALLLELKEQQPRLGDGES